MWGEKSKNRSKSIRRQICFVYLWTAIVITIWVLSASLCATNNLSCCSHLNWLRQTQPTCIKISNLSIAVFSLPCSFPLFAQSNVLWVHKPQTQSATNDWFIDEAGSYSLTQACNNYSPNDLKKREEKHGANQKLGPPGDGWNYVYSLLIGLHEFYTVWATVDAKSISVIWPRVSLNIKQECWILESPLNHKLFWCQFHYLSMSVWPVSSQLFTMRILLRKYHL